MARDIRQERLATFDTRYKVEQHGQAWTVHDTEERKIEAGPYPNRYRAEAVLSFVRQHCA